jgi:ATPase subunit of ABC transporter with duplicated ATPase domains
MIVTTQDVHDFCIATATIIPVLMLTRSIMERTPYEDLASSFIREQESILRRQLDNSTSILRDQENEIEKAKSSYRRFVLHGKKEKERNRQARTESAISAARAQLEEAEKIFNERHRSAESVARFLTTTGIWNIFLALLLAVVGEVVSLFGF